MFQVDRDDDETEEDDGGGGSVWWAVLVAGSNGYGNYRHQILLEEVEAELKEVVMISMGTEVSDLDLENIKYLCSQVLSFSEYRAQLYDNLKSRMPIAPNLTALVGELVGARLIAHGDSLVNLAKQTGSTVQILGIEKAVLRALKTKHATPECGLIYYASLIGQVAPKHKDKIARSLASKVSLAQFDVMLLEMVKILESYYLSICK